MYACGKVEYTDAHSNDCIFNTFTYIRIFTYMRIHTQLYTLSHMDTHSKARIRTTHKHTDTHALLHTNMPHTRAYETSFHRLISLPYTHIPPTPTHTYPPQQTDTPYPQFIHTPSLPYHPSLNTSNMQKQNFYEVKPITSFTKIKHRPGPKKLKRTSHTHTQSLMM